MPNSGLRSRLAASPVVRAGGTAGVIRAVGLLTALLLQLLLARLLADSTQYGVYAWTQNLLFLLGAIFALGIPMATSRLVAIQAGRGDSEAVATLRGAGARWLGLSAATGAAIGVTLIALLPDALFTSLPRSVCLIAVLAAPLVAFTMYFQSLARAQSRLIAAFGPTQVLRPALTAVYALAIFGFIDRTPGAIDILIAVCVALVSVLLLQLLLEGRPLTTDSKHEAREHPGAPSNEFGANQLIGNALPIFGTRLSDLLIKHGSTLALGIIGGPAAAAAFFVSDRLAQLATVPRSVVGSVVQPWLASAHAESDREDLQRTVRHAGHATLWPTLLAVIGLLALGSFLLGLFGGEYRDAYPVLAVLLAAHLLGAALGPAQQVLIMSGLQSLVLRVMVVAATTHLIALFLLIPLLGALGAAASTLISTSVARAGCLFLVRSRLDLDSSLVAPLFRKRTQTNRHDR
jgi:O-antigen/teichoic acid export membrane protein